MPSRALALVLPLLLGACGAAPASLDYSETIRGSEVAFDMVWVPEGGFWIGRTEVTWDEFLLYCDFAGDGTAPPGPDAVSKPSQPLDWTPFDHDWGTGRRPALGMSWNAAQKYCEWLSRNTGRDYRLPAEAEWALACGDGGAGPLAERAWFAENSGGKTQEVGLKLPNERGLHDLLGNVWEYCAEPWSAEEPVRAVLRGGSWKDPAALVTPAARLPFDEDWTLDDPNFPPGVWWVPAGDHLGLRVVREGTAPPVLEAPGPRCPAVVLPAGAAPLEVLAARELRRYLWLRTGGLAPIITQLPEVGDALLVSLAPGELAPEEFVLHSEEREGRRLLSLRGGSPRAVLYAAYRFAELLGVRFALHGDLIPDDRLADWRLPRVDERHAPLFAVRGIQPFHDFPEGPDWWSLDDYRAVLSQLPRLRMNFLGLHCYPEGEVGPEPLIWIGHPDDLDAAGEARFAYPSRWASTRGGAWGYDDLPAGEFVAGASQVFERDDFGPAATAGQRPRPTTPTGSLEVFQRAGALLAEVVEQAHRRGVQVCAGTETPLTVPAAVQERLRARGLDPAAGETVRALYRGIFLRLARRSPVDWYWLWTPEGWTWAGAGAEQVEATVRDLRLAREALHEIGDPFGFATCGWVLGPPDDPALFDRLLPPDAALSCINREVGFSPVEPGFAEVGGRPKWAIPWLEDDPALIVPQLWAGRVRRDAADALAYGCTGLIGIHWRTRVLAPNVLALAGAAWEQGGWNPELGRELPPPRRATRDVHLGGRIADYPANAIAGSAEPRVHQTCRWGLDGYRLELPDGRYTVRLHFCEVHYRAPGQRVFGVSLQGREVVHGLDVFARVGANAPLVLDFPGVVVDGGELAIDFLPEVEFPFVAGIEIAGETAAGEGEGRAFLRRIDCGGPARAGWEADLPEANSWDLDLARPRDLPAADLYADWAAAAFGPEAGPEIGRIFAALDGSSPGAGGRQARLPRPSDWDRGPGGIPANPLPWEQEQQRYAFVEELAAAGARITGPAARARFDYWLDSFRLLASVGRLGCLRGELDRSVAALEQEPDPERRRQRARDQALPVRLELARAWERLITLQLGLLSNAGELGTLANLEQHVRRHNAFLSLHDARLMEWLGEPLPAAAEPSRDYFGPARIVVPAVRPDLEEGEPLRLEVLLLDRVPMARAELRWRALGEDGFRSVPLHRRARAVHEAVVADPPGPVFEYWIVATRASGEELLWPAGAPERGQTVALLPRS